jgi:hypothetical protein
VLILPPVRIVLITVKRVALVTVQLAAVQKAIRQVNLAAVPKAVRQVNLVAVPKAVRQVNLAAVPKAVSQVNLTVAVLATAKLINQTTPIAAVLKMEIQIRTSAIPKVHQVQEQAAIGKRKHHDIRQ